MTEKTNRLVAGADKVNITPKSSLYLAGYPFVERISTGVLDPLFSTALYLSDGAESVLFIANDVIFVGKESARRVRKAIEEHTGIPQKNIMVTATHTHSGPSTVTFIAGTQDPLLPEINLDYIHLMEQGMINAACNAFDKSTPAELGLTIADGTGIGTNRHDPAGPCDLDVPVLLVRNAHDQNIIACMLICAMHPTVLHEDSTKYSGDFPGVAKIALEKQNLGGECPVLFHIGAAGNQSPRHVTKENTIAEATRIGNILANAVGKVLGSVQFSASISIRGIQHFIKLPRRKLPSAAEARKQLENAAQKLKETKEAGATRQQVRTAEVNWFGSVESLHLAELSELNALEEVYDSCMPAEIQIFEIGPWRFVGWPGEIFVEYALQVKEQSENTFVITLANGELQGYIVTKDAAEQGGYESSNAIFDSTSGDVLVSETLRLLKKNHGDEPVSGN